MELHEANRILRSVKSALLADGVKLPPSAETDGLMMLLDKIDFDKFIMPKIRRSRAASQGSAAQKRAAVYFRFFRALELLKKPAPESISTVSFMLLHKTVCGDLDPEAGRPRQSHSSDNGGAHTDPRYIIGSIKSIISKMNDIPPSPEIGRDEFSGYITHYMRELIILHPFENDSEFAVRVFMMWFCKVKGFALCYYRAAPSAIKDAESAAFLYDDVTSLYKIFSDCVSYEQKTLPPARTAPKTRREITRETAASVQEQNELMGEERRDDDDSPTESHKEPTLGKVVRKPANAEKLKRAIKLQHKITKLNEQLTELMKTTDSDGNNK